MPANERALHATDAYRLQIRTLHRRAQALAHTGWQEHLDGADLDASVAAYAERTAPGLTVLQRTGARVSAAYLAAYITVSTGRRAALTGASAAAPVGEARTGTPLDEALTKPVIAVKQAIGGGAALDAALRIGADAAARNAGEDFMYAARSALFGGIADSEQIVGWRRVTGGGCGACMALADGTILSDDSDIEVHDNCQCSAEPVLRDAPDDVLRPTGNEMFDAMPADAQDALLGPDKALLIRDGRVPFHALVARSPLRELPDQITEASLEDLHAH